MRTYGPIRSPYWIILDGDEARIERLRFHIERGDYFPFLATVFGMLGETIAAGTPLPEIAKTQAAFADDMRKDLLYLHERYDLAPKAKKLAYTKEKMVRFDP